MLTRVAILFKEDPLHHKNLLFLHAGHLPLVFYVPWLYNEGITEMEKSMNDQLTHLDDQGNAIMVDVSAKAATSRKAVAQGCIQVIPAILSALTAGENPKGDVLAAARIAGIMAAKNTSGLIPLCHPLMITHCTVDFTLDAVASTITATCTVKVGGKTGVEMEALTGVSVALLTIYDMCKALDKGMVISDIHLLTKSGGKSGDFEFGKE